MSQASSDDWKEIVDPKGCVYYTNLRTGLSQWQKPVVIVEEPLSRRSSSFLENFRPASDDWQAITDPKGRVYYFNPRLGVTSWTMKRSAESHEEEKQLRVHSSAESSAASSCPPPSFATPSVSCSTSSSFSSPTSSSSSPTSMTSSSLFSASSTSPTSSLSSAPSSFSFSSSALAMSSTSTTVTSASATSASAPQAPLRALPPRQLSFNVPQASPLSLSRSPSGSGLHHSDSFSSLMSSFAGTRIPSPRPPVSPLTPTTATSVPPPPSPGSPRLQPVRAPIVEPMVVPTFTSYARFEPIRPASPPVMIQTETSAGRMLPPAPPRSPEPVRVSIQEQSSPTSTYARRPASPPPQSPPPPSNTRFEHQTAPLPASPPLNGNFRSLEQRVRASTLELQQQALGSPRLGPPTRVPTPPLPPSTLTTARAATDHPRALDHAVGSAFSRAEAASRVTSFSMSSSPPSSHFSSLKTASDRSSSPDHRISSSSSPRPSSSSTRASSPTASPFTRALSPSASPNISSLSRPFLVSTTPRPSSSPHPFAQPTQSLRSIPPLDLASPLPRSTDPSAFKTNPATTLPNRILSTRDGLEGTRSPVASPRPTSLIVDVPHSASSEAPVNTTRHRQTNSSPVHPLDPPRPFPSHTRAETSPAISVPETTVEDQKLVEIRSKVLAQTQMFLVRQNSGLATPPAETLEQQRSKVLKEFHDAIGRYSSPRAVRAD